VAFPRPPDWLVYGAIVGGLLFLSFGRRERANAPEAPPPIPGEAQMPLAAASPFSSSPVVPVGVHVETMSGTAFSVGDAGVWLTAGHVLAGCRQPAIVVAAGRGVAARLRAIDGDVAVLTTEGGSPALPLAVLSELHAGQRGYLPGYPHRAPGEAATRLLGSQQIRGLGRGAATSIELAWAEIGRTDGLKGSLAGLSGAPVLNAAGDVVGVTLGEAPRRGRVYTATPDTVRRALVAAGVKPPPPGSGQPINVENYGRVADGLRRDLRVAQVVCLAV
jgi:serine protease Do